MNSNGGFDINSTFDAQMPDIERISETISPLSSLIGQRTEAILFAYKLFLNKPKLFGINAETLLYAQHAGHKYKPASYYNIFETFIKHINSKYILDKRKELLTNPFAYDTDYIITWARLIKENQMLIEFEPVMRHLKAVLNNWFSDPKVCWGGINYPINTFKPLCYTYSGECVISLLPYICYLFTFFIHCKPYEFDEGQSESSTFGFYKTLEAWYMKHYTELGKDFKVDIIKDSANAIQMIDERYWVDMFNHMLNVDEIVKMRNTELARTPSLLEHCIQDQNGLTYDYIQKSFNDVMSNLLKIIIANNPLKRLFDAIPRFDPKTLNVNDLMMWTQYCMTGGNKPFCIEPDTPFQPNLPNKTGTYSYTFHCDPKDVKPLPRSILGRQELKTSIKELSISKLRPFTCSDLILEACTAYIKKEFLKKRTDVLDDMPIKIDESMLRNDQLLHKPLSEILKDLFINGLWMFDNSSLYEILNLLLSNRSFASEMSDLLSLGAVTQMVYDNRLASIIISTYLISYINTWVLDTCVNGYSLFTFSPYVYIAQMERSSSRITKLLDIVTSLLYLGNPLYARFVNVCMGDFIGMLTTNHAIVQPYVKGLNDKADIYAIGGCELYNYSHYSNPLIRGYGFVVSNFGNSEEVETFYNWIYGLDNNALFEVIDESLDNVQLISSSLKAQWTKMNESGVYPIMLRNYVFNGSGYKLKNFPYFLNLTLSDGRSVLEMICNYTFAFSNPKDSTVRKIYTRTIDYMNGHVKANAPVVNGVRLGRSLLPMELSNTGTIENVPVYDFNGSMEELGVSYVNPGGMRMEKLMLFNSRMNENNVIWIFTDYAVNNRFQRYELMKESAGVTGAEGSYGYRVDPRESRVIVG